MGYGWPALLDSMIWTYLSEKPGMEENLQSVEAYREQYGAPPD